VSDLYPNVKPKDSKEPPIIPQKMEVKDPVVMYTEARLHEKLFAKLKGIIIHIAYLGTYHTA